MYGQALCCASCNWNKVDTTPRRRAESSLLLGSPSRTTGCSTVQGRCHRWNKIGHRLNHKFELEINPQVLQKMLINLSSRPSQNSWSQTILVITLSSRPTQKFWRQKTNHNIKLETNAKFARLLVLALKTRNMTRKLADARCHVRATALSISSVRINTPADGAAKSCFCLKIHYTMFVVLATTAQSLPSTLAFSEARHIHLGN